MISVKFYNYSDSEQYIENLKVDIQDSFQMYYPNSEISVNKVDDEFQFIFNDNWSDVEEIDLDVINDICSSNEVYCSILVNDEINENFYYDE